MLSLPILYSYILQVYALGLVSLLANFLGNFGNILFCGYQYDGLDISDILWNYALVVNADFVWIIYNTLCFCTLLSTDICGFVHLTISSTSRQGTKSFSSWVWGEAG